MKPMPASQGMQQHGQGGTRQSSVSSHRVTYGMQNLSTLRSLLDYSIMIYPVSQTFALMESLRYIFAACAKGMGL